MDGLANASFSAAGFSFSLQLPGNEERFTGVVVELFPSIRNEPG